MATASAKRVLVQSTESGHRIVIYGLEGFKSSGGTCSIPSGPNNDHWVEITPRRKEADEVKYALAHAYDERRRGSIAMLVVHSATAQDLIFGGYVTIAQVEEAIQYGGYTQIMGGVALNEPDVVIEEHGPLVLRILDAPGGRWYLANAAGEKLVG